MSPSLLGDRSAEGAELFALGSQNGEPWCTLGRIFTVELAACLAATLTSRQSASPILTNRMSDRLFRILDTSVIFPCSRTLGLYACISGAFEELAKLACLLAW